MYISQKFKWKRKIELEHEQLECLWIEIFPEKAKSWLLCTIYRPPDTSLYLPKNFNELFNNMLEKASNESNSDIVLMGDINVNFLCRRNNDIKSILTLHGLKQLVTKATRVTENTSSLIDIIATNNESKIVKTEVIPLGISDHDMIGSVRKANHQKHQRRRRIMVEN